MMEPVQWTAMETNGFPLSGLSERKNLAKGTVMTLGVVGRHHLATLQDASINLQQLASFLTRYIQQQATYDRTGRWETHGYAHTHAAAPGCSHRDETFPKRVNHRTIQMVQCIIPMRRLIYYINWLASKLMITDGSSPISSLVPDCNPPKAATLVLADGTLGTSATPMPSQCPRQPQETLPKFPQLLPPWRKFLPTETKLRLLLLWNSVGLDVFLKCVLVTEKRRGDPLCILSGIPLPQD